MASISISRARDEFSRLIERTLAGEDIVVARRGKPAIRLVRVEPAQAPRKPGALKGLFTVADSFFEPLPDEILEAFDNSPIEPEERLSEPEAPDQR